MHMNSSILYCELVAVWLSDVIIRSLLARSTGYCEKGGWLPYCPASMSLPQLQRAGKPVPGRCVSATKTPYCLALPPRESPSGKRRHWITSRLQTVVR